MSSFTSQNHENGVSQGGPLEALWPPEGPPRAPQSTKAPSGPSWDPCGTRFGPILDPFQTHFEYNRAINRSIKQPIKQSITRVINQAINQSSARYLERRPNGPLACQTLSNQSLVYLYSCILVYLYTCILSFQIGSAECAKRLNNTISYSL